MKMGSKAAGRSHEINNLVRQKVWLDGRDTIPVHPLHLVKGLDKVDKPLLGGVPEIPYIHAREHDLLTTLFHHLFGLLHQVGYRPVTAPSPCKGNGAEGTKIVASILHFQKIARAVVRRDRRYKGAYAVCL